MKTLKKDDSSIGTLEGLPWWLNSKESACDAEDARNASSSIPGSGRSPGRGHGNPL